MNLEDQASCDPTEKTLYTEPHSDHFGTFQDRLFQTGSGPRKGIGIEAGGMVYVLPLKKWHGLAEGHADATKEKELCNHKTEHKEVLGLVLCVCSSHCQELLRKEKEKAEKLVKALKKIMDVYIDSSLGQIVDSEHYEKCWYDCQDIAKEALAEFRKE